MFRFSKGYLTGPKFSSNFNPVLWNILAVFHGRKLAPIMQLLVHQKKLLNSYDNLNNYISSQLPFTLYFTIGMTVQYIVGWPFQIERWPQPNFSANTSLRDAYGQCLHNSIVTVYFRLRYQGPGDLQCHKVIKRKVFLSNPVSKLSVLVENSMN